jgi:hypothetical protein
MTAAQAENDEVFFSLSLAARGFALRSEADADVAFLRRLYASTRAAELELANWSDTRREPAWNANTFGFYSLQGRLP